MSKVTEARKKILEIIRTHSPHYSTEKIQELVLDDSEWNDPKEAKKEDGEQEQTEEGYRSGLDVLIDFFPDE